MQDPAVTRFREYLRIPSVHPNPDYSRCIKWLENQSQEIGLQYNYLKLPDNPEPSEFVIWLTWTGSEPHLKSILLNSHIDVVPVEKEKWNYEPFGAEKDSEGNIYARGAQDMKSVGVQYLEAIRKLRLTNFTPRRTIHVSFVPEEEVGGFKGMARFVKTTEFKNLNIGFSMDEGIPSQDDSFNLFYGERVGSDFTITAKGATGHVSLLPTDTALHKLLAVIQRIQALREDQIKLLETNPKLELGDVTTYNLVGLKGGIGDNVIPSELSATFSMRISADWILDDALNKMKQICSEIGPDVTLFYKPREYSNITPMTWLTDDNIWWTTFKQTCDKIGLKINSKIFPAATDSRYLRQIGIPAFGFSPINNTPSLLHDHNEFLNENIFLNGIHIYEHLIKAIVNIQQSNFDTI